MILTGRARLPMSVQNHNKSCGFLRMGSGWLAAKPLLLIGDLFRIFRVTIYSNLKLFSKTLFLF